MPIMTNSEIIGYIESRKAAPEGMIASWLKKTFGHPDPEDDPRYTGDETFDVRSYNTPMKEFYFYYFGPGSEDTLRTLVYYQKGHGKPSDLDLGKMIVHARTGKGPFNPEPDIDQVEWHEPGYLVFFFDFKKWEFLTDGGKNKSLYFAHNKKKKHNGNYCFFNAKSIQVDFKNEEDKDESRQCLIVENHHFKADGQYTSRVPGYPEEFYKFDIYVGQPIDGVPDKKMWFVVDPGGRNVGPP